MQDRHDADIAIGEQLPIYEMPLIPADIAVHCELRRDRTPRKATLRYGGEALEQAMNIVLGLRVAPGVARIAVDLVQPIAGAVLKRRVDKRAISLPRCG
jgi:hypothetical protein